MLLRLHCTIFVGETNKMKRIAASIWMTLWAVVMIAAPIGDVNGDGEVGVPDVTLLVSIVSSNGADVDEPTLARADVNGDGEVGVADVTRLVSIILSEEQPVTPAPTGYDYVWDPTVLPEIHIHISQDEWQNLLNLYDANPRTRQYVKASDFVFVHDNEYTVIDDIGLRLKGNTSRRRPQVGGRKQHVHFGVNLRKYVKDANHELQGVRKLHLKWFKDDPAYVRELYCYNLFRDFGVWTAPRDHYCRLWLQVEGESEETYYGVYEMIEHVDERYVKQRMDSAQFKSDKGNLWKCKYVNGMASLTNPYGADMWWDDNSDNIHTYELKTDNASFEDAKAQLVDFMLKLNGKGRDSFHNWIQQVCDVDLLLKTYAVNVAVGMWDDYWNNGNNYYLYFDSTDLYDYKFYLIPYDYDNTLGTSLQCGNQSDSGRQNPLEWGRNDIPLIKRILEYDDWREIYVNYLKQLVSPVNDLLHVDRSTARILAWQAMIAPYVANDTGEDMEIRDEPAPWGNHSEYRLIENNNNFFIRKRESINALP